MRKLILAALLTVAFAGDAAESREESCTKRAELAATLATSRDMGTTIEQNQAVIYESANRGQIGKESADNMAALVKQVWGMKENPEGTRKFIYAECMNP